MHRGILSLGYLDPSHLILLRAAIAPHLPRHPQMQDLDTSLTNSPVFFCRQFMPSIPARYLIGSNFIGVKAAAQYILILPPLVLDILFWTCRDYGLLRL